MTTRTITIVGVGALGSHAALLLRNEGLLRLVDFDRVEQKNTLSQFHGTRSVGKNKAVALKEVLQFLFGVKAGALTARLEANNVRELLSGSDLVLDCVDNGETRKLVQDHCREAGLPCLHGALAADGSFGQVVWTESFRVDYGDAGRPTCEDGAHLPFISAVSSLLARCAQEFLKTGKRRGFQVHAGGAVPI